MATTNAGTLVPTQEILLRPEDVARLLGTSTAWVYEKTRNRQRDPLPCLRLGRYCRFEKATVLAWARQRGNTAARKIAKAVPRG